MSIDGRIQGEPIPIDCDRSCDSAAGGLAECGGAVRMTATGHLQAEDDEGNCEYKWRLIGITDERFQHLVTQMKFRVAEGQGRCLYEIGVADDGSAMGLCDDEYEESIATVRKMADELGFQVKIAYERIVDTDGEHPLQSFKQRAKRGQAAGARIQLNDANQASKGHSPKQSASVRRRCAEIHVTRVQKQVEDLRIAFCGLGGSGKSTLVGVLTQGSLDDGSGKVRSTVFNHKHEVDTGCTSSVTNHVIGFDAVGRVTNYDEERLSRTPIISPTLSSGALSSVRAREIPQADSPACDAGSAGIYDDGTATLDYALNATRTIAERSVKLVTLLDLGGQDKYSKTAYFGITSKAPGYACIVAAADTSIISGIGLHVSICMALRIPFCVVITKCDTVGELELDDLQLEVDDYIRGEARQMGFDVKTRTCSSYEDVLDGSLITECVGLTTVPVFLTSCVEGSGIGYLKTFFHKLPSVAQSESSSPSAEVLVDGCFHVSSVGPVLSGLVTKGEVHEGQQLLMGPDRHGHFQCITVRGIHEKGSHVTRATAGTDATFCVGHIPNTLDANRKGTVLLGIGTVHPQVCMLFECRIRIIDGEGAPVGVGQEPILHCRNIRQAIRLIAVSQSDTIVWPSDANDLHPIDGQVLRPRSEGMVLCRFLFHPEVLEVGSSVLFRWSRSVRAVGTITRLAPPTPCTSPHMRPTPIDMFEPMEAVPEEVLLPEEVKAIKSIDSSPQQQCKCVPHSTFSQLSPSIDVADDLIAGADLFGSSDSESDQRQRHQKTRRSNAKKKVETPPDDVAGATPTSGASSEGCGMDTFGDDVMRKFPTALLRSQPQSPNSCGKSAFPTTGMVRTVSNTTSSRSPEMKAYFTAEYDEEKFTML